MICSTEFVQLVWFDGKVGTRAAVWTGAILLRWFNLWCLTSSHFREDVKHTNESSGDRCAACSLAVHHQNIQNISCFFRCWTKKFIECINFFIHKKNIFFSFHFNFFPEKPSLYNDITYNTFKKTVQTFLFNTHKGRRFRNSKKVFQKTSKIMWLKLIR